VLELEEAEFKRLEKAASPVAMPDYIRAVVNAVLNYRDSEPLAKPPQRPQARSS
jgi:hypothetical protein